MNIIKSAHFTNYSFTIMYVITTCDILMFVSLLMLFGLNLHAVYLFLMQWLSVFVDATIFLLSPIFLRWDVESRRRCRWIKNYWLKKVRNSNGGQQSKLDIKLLKLRAMNSKSNIRFFVFLVVFHLFVWI